MSFLEQDVLAHHVPLDQQEISVLERGTKSLKTSWRAEEPELRQPEEEDNESKPPQFVRKESKVVVKQEPHTLKATDSGSGEVKEELEELELQLIKYDCQSERLLTVQIEVEDSCENENQFVLKQQTYSLVETFSSPYKIKGGPVELQPKPAKEEEDGSEPQLMANIKTDSISKTENEFVLKQVTDTLILRGYDKETDQQQPESNGNQNLFQNITEEQHHHQIKIDEASGASEDEGKLQRGHKRRGQSDNVENGLKSKKTTKVKKCSV